MAAVNKVILVGNLGRDPELRRTQSGSAVTNFSIATTEKFKDKNGQQQDQTEWHNIVAWEKPAEILAQYLKKGSSVYIEGKLRTRSWEDNGTKKYRTEVLVREFQFLGGRNDGGQQGNQGGFGGGANNFGDAPSGFGSQQDSGFSQEPSYGFGGGNAPQSQNQQQQSHQPQGQHQPQNQGGFGGGSAPQQQQQRQAPAEPVQPQMPIDEDLPF